MKQTTNKQWYVLLVLMLSVGVFFSACKKDKDDPKPNITKIPSDSEATPPPDIKNHRIDSYIPNLSVSTDNTDPNHIILQMTGIKEPDSRSSYIQLKGTGDAKQNIWLQVDGKNKGFLVTKNSNSGSSAKLVDMVFTVDNSGSMNSEADTIAMQIKNWVNYLNTQNLNLKVGIVGYDDGGDISGALNFTDAKTLEYYLVDRKLWGEYPIYGTNRTVGFYGADSATLSQEASAYAPNIYGENGMVAVRFAHEHFVWRSSANRIYVNFTDEPNQTSYNSDSLFSVYSIKNHWNATDGTIHTVFSSDTIYSGNWSQYEEKPWLMSEYTGGQAVFVNSDATDLDLNTLPVTGALAETFLLEYINNEGSGTHDIQIYVKSNTSDADGTRIYKDISYK